MTFERGPTQLVASLAASGISPEVASLEPRQQAPLDQKAAEFLAPLLVDGRVESKMTSNIGLAFKPS